jgi:hypothetical protein
LVTQIAQYNWRTQWIKTEAGSDVQQCSDEQKLWVSHEGVRLLGCKSIEKPERGYSRVVVSITFKALLIWYLRSFLSSQLALSHSSCKCLSPAGSWRSQTCSLLLSKALAPTLPLVCFLPGLPGLASSCYSNLLQDTFLESFALTVLCRKHLLSIIPKRFF